MEAPNLNTLPDDAAIHILSKLTLGERQRALPLVGRRWHELANSPQLCRRLAVTLGQGKRVLDKLCSLSYWLLNSGAAGHVEQLALEMAHPGNGKGVIGETAAAQTVCGILAACGATGRLTDVHVSLNMNSGITLGSWATLALRSVRCLHITAEGAVRVTASLLPLTALEELRLEGFTQLRDPCLYQGARLPPSITHLHLGGAAFGGLPTQILELTRLQRLSLGTSLYYENGYTSLLQLTTLQCLAMTGCKMPDCLPRLTFLRSLTLMDEDDGVDGEALEPVLWHLTRLTHLEVGTFLRQGMSPPAAVAGLSQLASLVWGDDLSDGPPDAALPAGPWLASLRRLSASAGLLLCSLPTLLKAPQLQILHMHPAWPVDEITPIICWAPSHPGLTQLSWCAGASLPTDTCAAALQAQRSRPDLSIHPSATSEALRHLFFNAQPA